MADDVGQWVSQPCRNLNDECRRRLKMRLHTIDGSAMMLEHAVRAIRVVKSHKWCISNLSRMIASYE